jgi:hypothetical protein
VIGVTLACFAVEPMRTRRRTLAAPTHELDLRAAVVSAAAIGLLGGLVGLAWFWARRGCRAPLGYVGETPARAVGTNMAVGVCVGIAGVVGHLASGLDWRAFWIGARLPFQVRSSARMTGLLASAQLMRAVAVVLLIAGVSMLVQAFV